MKKLWHSGVIGISIGVLCGVGLVRGQTKQGVRLRWFIDAASHLGRELTSSEDAEENYARGYVAGAYDGWIATTASSAQGEKISSCVFTQKPISSSEIATIFQAYSIKHPETAPTPAWLVMKAALDETYGIK
jgi:hypothetical protein